MRPRPDPRRQLILAHLERASCSLDLGPDAPPDYERARQWDIREGHHLGARRGGLLAVAGYQNRDKIAEMLSGIGQGTPGGAGQSTPGGAGPSGGISGLLGQLSRSFTGASAGGILSGGLGELVARFKQSGHGETAESWVGTGPNKPVTPPQLEQAIGPDVLETLSKQTGLSREELLARLSRELPDAVDKYTPQGRLPTETDFPRS